MHKIRGRYHSVSLRVDNGHRRLWKVAVGVAVDIVVVVVVVVVVVGVTGADGAGRIEAADDPLVRRLGGGHASGDKVSTTATRAATCDAAGRTSAQTGGRLELVHGGRRWRRCRVRRVVYGDERGVGVVRPDECAGGGRRWLRLGVHGEVCGSRRHRLVDDLQVGGALQAGQLATVVVDWRHVHEL